MRAIMFFILSFSLVVHYKYSKKVEKRDINEGYDYFRQDHVYCPRPQGGNEMDGVDRVERWKMQTAFYRTTTCRSMTLPPS